jgi:hypothetical protein
LLALISKMVCGGIKRKRERWEVGGEEKIPNLRTGYTNRSADGTTGVGPRRMNSCFGVCVCVCVCVENIEMRQNGVVRCADGCEQTAISVRRVDQRSSSPLLRTLPRSLFRNAKHPSKVRRRSAARFTAAYAQGEGGYRTVHSRVIIASARDHGEEVHVAVECSHCTK